MVKENAKRTTKPTANETTKSTTKPTAKETTKLLTLAAVMTAVMAVCAQIAVPLPFAGVVLSLGTFGVFAAGLVLPPRYAALSIGAYVLLGLVGVPVFAGFVGGAGAVIGPTGGFIIAYPIMAWLTALVKGENMSMRISILRAVLGCLAALIVCYLFGSVWYSFWAHMSLTRAASLVALPFVPFDAVKAAFAIAIVKSVRVLTDRLTSLST
jgi:biotin transport system substrate-specific component